jgi:hypothetical protein
MNKVKTLLGLKLYEISGDDIGKHFLPGKKDLPEYCINDKDGQVLSSSYWLQFVNSGEDKYVLFDFKTADEILSHEIYQCGLCEFLQGTDMRLFIEEFRKQGAIGTYNDYFTSISKASYVVVQITYYGDSFTDYDMHIECPGILDDEFNFVEIEQNKVKV